MRGRKTTVSRSLLGLGLVLLLTGLVLAACGDATPAPPTATPLPPTPTASPSPTPKPAVKGDLTVWSWGTAAQGLQANIAGFNRKYPDVKVKLETLDRLDLYDKFTTGLSAGGVGLPDVVTLETERLEGLITKFPEGLANLTERAGIYEKNFDPGRWAKSDLKNRVRAMPWDVAPAGLFYRTDLFQQAGVDPSSIETWDDFIRAGQKIQGFFPGLKMLALDPAKDDSLFRLILGQQGAYYFNKDGKISLTSPAALNAMAIIQKLKAANLILTVNGSGEIAAAKNNQVAAQPAGSWWAGVLSQAAPELKGKWDVMLLPAVTRGGNRAASLGGTTLAISSKTKNIEAAWAYIEYNLATTEGQTTIFKTAGILPAFLPAYADPAFTANQPYFNNKAIWKTFLNELPQVASPSYNMDNQLGQAASLAALADVFKGSDPQTALAKAAEDLKAKTGRDLEVEPTTTVKR
jgi:lactose/L-arabinose transport system substrate-binding protein